MRINVPAVVADPSRQAAICPSRDFNVAARVAGRRHIGGEEMKFLPIHQRLEDLGTLLRRPAIIDQKARDRALSGR